jgi:two-component system OmpR family sensor kinase
MISRSGERGRSADDLLLIAAARRIGVQIAVACALAVAVVAVVTFVLLRHHGEPSRAVPDRSTDHDDLVRDALLIAGVVGILIAGAVGYLAAKRAIGPLGEALTLQRRFVADAGHELRTPLTVLHTRAQLLARRIPAGDPAQQTAEQLLDDSRMLGEIIDELLVSAQLSSDPQLGESIHLREIAADAVATMDVLARESNVSLRCAGPDSADTTLVNGSRSALRRAAVGLVDNAITHVRPGGEVLVRVAVYTDWTELTVTDNGPGFDTADPMQLTRRFAQGNLRHPIDHQRPMGNQRYGLGLALIREIAVAHGGTFAVKNGEPTGATATIRLPLVERIEPQRRQR